MCGVHIDHGTNNMLGWGQLAYCNMDYPLPKTQEIKGHLTQVAACLKLHCRVSEQEQM